MRCVEVVRVALCIFTYKDDFDSFKYDFDVALKSINDVDTLFVVHNPFNSSVRYDVFFDSLLLNNVKLIEKDVGVSDLVGYFDGKGFDLVVIKSEVGFYVKRIS